MGTWGVHSFENDDAAEWAAAYREMGLSVAKSTIDIALSDHSNNRLTADLACRAIAAVEAVAFVLGRGSPDAYKAFDGGPEPDLSLANDMIPDCNHMIAAITGASTLKDLWVEAGGGSHEDWLASLTDLGARINGAPKDEAPAPAAETPEAASVLSSEVDLDDIRRSISALDADIQTLRQETAENFRRLAQQIEGLKR